MHKSCPKGQFRQIYIYFFLHWRIHVNSFTKKSSSTFMLLNTFLASAWQYPHALKPEYSFIFKLLMKRRSIKMYHILLSYAKKVPSFFPYRSSCTRGLKTVIGMDQGNTAWRGFHQRPMRKLSSSISS